MGTSAEGEPYAPKNGDYFSMVVHYEGDGLSYIYDSAGIYTPLDGTNSGYTKEQINALLADKDSVAVVGSGAPTSSTKADNVGQSYYDSTNHNFYQCTGITPQGTIPETYVYAWEELAAAGDVNTLGDRVDNLEDAQSDIYNYLNVKVTHAYENVAAMKADTELEDGALVATYGFHEINDGGGALYQVRELADGDDVDEIIIFALADASLVAEIIVEDPINVKKYGVKSDGQTDGISIISKLISKYPLHTLYFPSGEYNITSPIKIPTNNASNVNLTFDQNAVLKANAAIDCLIYVGEEAGSWDRYSNGSITMISGGTIDATNADKAIRSSANRKQTIFTNMTIINVAHYGVYNERGTNTSISTDNVYDTISIDADRSSSNSCAFYGDSYDNKYTHLKVCGFKTGFDFRGSGHVLEDVHILGSWVGGTPTKADYESVTGMIFSAGGHFMMTDIYMDTLSKSFVKTGQNLDLSISNLFFYWWASDSTFNTTLFELHGTQSERFYLDNVVISTPNSGSFIGIDLSDTGPNYRNFFPSYEQWRLSHVKIDNRDRYAIDDFIFCKQIYDDDVYYQASWWQEQMTANTYYSLGKVMNPTTLHIQASNDQIIEAVVSPGDDLIKIRNIASIGQANVYTLALCNKTTNSDGAAVADLCVKCSTQRPKNISINTITSGIGKLFARDGYSEALTSPTVNAEESFNPV